MSQIPRVKEEQHASFASGAVRSRPQGKGRFDLISPWAMTALARHMEKGVTEGNYDARNWERGLPVTRFVDSCIRHLMQWQAGQTDEPHLEAALWNLHGAVDHVARILEGRLPTSLLEGLPLDHPLVREAEAKEKP